MSTVDFLLELGEPDPWIIPIVDGRRFTEIALELHPLRPPDSHRPVPYGGIPFRDSPTARSQFLALRGARHRFGSKVAVLGCSCGWVNCYPFKGPRVG